MTYTTVDGARAAWQMLKDVCRICRDHRDNSEHCSDCLVSQATIDAEYYVLSTLIPAR